MGRDRTNVMGARTGLAGLIDKVRYKEIYRQAIGLVLVAACAWAAEPGEVRVIIGLTVALAGQVFRVFAAGTIFKNQKLASTGAYSVVRHPLYLGNLLILVGFGLAAGNFVVTAVLLIFWFLWYPTAIRYEDQKLESIFGEDWREWSQGTNAVLPRGLNLSKLLDTNWKAGQSFIRNGELYISIYLAACGYWLWQVAH